MGLGIGKNFVSKQIKQNQILMFKITKNIFLEFIYSKYKNKKIINANGRNSWRRKFKEKINLEVYLAVTFLLRYPDVGNQ